MLYGPYLPAPKNIGRVSQHQHGSASQTQSSQKDAHQCRLPLIGADLELIEGPAGSGKNKNREKDKKNSFFKEERKIQIAAAVSQKAVPR